MNWTVEQILEAARAYQPAAILHAAADLDLFTQLSSGPFTAEDAANSLAADLRGLRVLLDALAALGLLDKKSGRYEVPASVAKALSSRSPGNVLAMVQHQGSCLRRWMQLARIIKTGQPGERISSIRGHDADYASFIEAMDNLAAPVADSIIASLPLGEFHHVLDVGGGSGSWTIAFLRRNPHATATIFDLPKVMPQANDRIAKAGLSDRVKLVPGDFYVDPLPNGADLAWVSAIVHQNSREQNRELFSKVFASLEKGGRILIRDIVMEESRTAPLAGALFAVNMLSGPHTGGTFTLNEMREDLESPGFRDVSLIRKDKAMHSVVSATKPR